ncbi:glycosyl transferase, partial [Kosakonia sp. H7A]|uniref:glycosyltransferase n=1 Tax=Kosakonia sp. H7A TaxID=2054598 RepID=UPI000D472ACD
LGLAECMAMGKPVIGSGWSGNMDFMDARNSCPVGYRMVPVAADAYPGGAGAEWAEPDIDQAAMYMRRLVDEPGLAAALGQQAAHDIQQSNAPAVAGRLIRERLRQLEKQPRHKDNEHMGDAA